MSTLHLTVVQQLVFAIQVGLSLLFFLAAFPKLRRPQAFITTVRAYRLLPASVAPVVAITVGVSELSLATMFLFALYVPIALFASGVLILLFAVAIGINLRRNNQIPCGCFGGNEAISDRSLLRLLVLGTAVALVAVVGPSNVHLSIVVTNGAAGIRFLAAAFSVAGSLVLAGAWLLSFREVSHLFQLRTDRG